jgi:hypothetical protein
MNSLVGYTGFVGSNLAKHNCFDFLYNSKNIRDSYGTKPELLVYCGVRAEKFLANKNPEEDYGNILDAYNNMLKIEPKIIVLISTVDVYKIPLNVDELSEITTDGLHPYGLNRYKLEQLVLQSGIKAHIIRLPGLYGDNIKKNFIYDLINIIPSMLNEQKYNELFQKNPLIENFYNRNENGFYKCRQLNRQEHVILKRYFEDAGFTALNFTDSRGVFQYYNLDYLWWHIQLTLKHDIELLNIVTEPVSAEEVYKVVRKGNFVNYLSNPVPAYDVRSRYTGIFSQNGDYIFNKDFVLRDIERFVRKMAGK